MKIKKPFIPLFKKFIADTKSGKRLKKNGERIKPASIKNYEYVLKNIVDFSIKTGFELRICDALKLNKREYVSEKNYWKKFYKKFTTYLYAKGCYDNYVGSNMKIIRSFFNYLANDKNMRTGDFQKLFYVRREEIQILVLSPKQLKFLIYDLEFKNSLSPMQKTMKDIFVFGCTTGLRYSDVFSLTNKNFEKQNNAWYLKVKSQKTKTFTSIKLPDYAVTIYKKYKPKSAKTLVFKQITLYNFNKNLKAIGEKAGFTQPIQMSREKQGKVKQLKGKQIRFCDKMSSHLMRRTAITTLLILGMPEHLVRKISGHSSTSNSFNRYVHYAQAYMDREIEKVYDKFDAL